MTIELRVNGETRAVEADAETPLLYALRNDLGLKGSRFGCGEGTCGACMVLVDGEATPSCDMPLSVAEGKDVVTIESADSATLERLRAAFEAEQAGQCAYCATGILIAAAGLLERNATPSREEIGAALDDNLCRCGAHARMIRAVERAASGVEPVPVRIGPEPVEDPPEGGLGNSHLTVTGEGTVVMTSGKVDLGQGATTALAQIAADALGVSIHRIRIVRTDTARSPEEGTTAGSYTISRGGAAMREAAEELRLRLLALASEDLGEAETLEVRDGTITSASGRSTTYWALAGGEDTIGPGEDDPVDGTAFPRWDLPRKFRGLPSFIQDVELPGMLHGRVVRPPGRGHTLSELEQERTEAMPGVVGVVRDGDYVGVIAEREDQVLRAVRALGNDATWSAPDPSGVDLNDPEYLREREGVRTALSEPGEEQVSGTSVSASYTRGFLAHGSIGPSCGIARWDDDRLTVWSHTQGVFSLRSAISQALDMPEDRIRVIHREGAGCYGHNGADDAAFDAVLLARTVPGHPVRVQWSREDEFAWEPYGPAMVIDLSATLDDDGTILEWRHEAWSHPHSARPGRVDGISLLGAHLVEDAAPPPNLKPLPIERGAGMLRNAVPMYDVPSASVFGHFIEESPVRTSALRALGAHPNVFAIESFMDELAEAAGVDPVEFRLRHLSDERARGVIEAVVERAGVPVGGQSEEGHGFGIGFARYKNTSCYVAVIAEVEAEQEIRLVRAWAALDAGHVVNPDGAANQIEGGMLQSASWALKERISFDGDLVASRSWLDYPILTFSEVPELDVVVLDRPGDPALGVGEGSQGPMTAAIGNAVHAALGVRVRDLPLTPDRVMKAILG